MLLRSWLASDRFFLPSTTGSPTTLLAVVLGFVSESVKSGVSSTSWKSNGQSWLAPDFALARRKQDKQHKKVKQEGNLTISSAAWLLTSGASGIDASSLLTGWRERGGMLAVVPR